ncbi:MAG TPA: efflux RND transporter periplasmic adaptor subunit [Bryobacteraceae bacterium]|jgi:RND family efflux transporter MFP subunit
MRTQIETSEDEGKAVVSGKAPKSRKIGFAGAALLLAALLAVGILPRLAREREALAAARESPVTHPVVSIIHPEKGQPTAELMLPGNIEPLYSANIYARANGYVDRRNVDIGSKVKAGQLLAVISSPEIDQQLQQANAALGQSEAALQQAEAALDQAKANAELARLTKERDLPLGAQRAISRQIVDEAVQTYSARVADVAAAEANIAAAEANVKANRANVARLEQLQSFERIVAPFDGVITERNVERGDLVNGGSATAGKPLFAIAQSGKVRVQVDVPQSQAVNIDDGQEASLHVRERMGRTYKGKVVRTASSLDDAARTMLTEVQVDNKDGSLLPGMYAQVTFTIPQGRTSFVIPTSSLVINHSGTRVVTVNEAGRIHFAPVTIGRDMGTQVELLGGLDGTESIVGSPSDLLQEGEKVEVR